MGSGLGARGRIRISGWKTKGRRLLRNRPVLFFEYRNCLQGHDEVQFVSPHRDRYLDPSHMHDPHSCSFHHLYHAVASEHVPKGALLGRCSVPRGMAKPRANTATLGHRSRNGDGAGNNSSRDSDGAQSRGNSGDNSGIQPKKGLRYPHPTPQRRGTRKFQKAFARKDSLKQRGVNTSKRDVVVGGQLMPPLVLRHANMKTRVGE